jgi:hypothetical protein
LTSKVPRTYIIRTYSLQVVNNTYPKQSEEIMTQDQKKAIILALFLGGVGAHHYYLGRPWWAVASLLTCWTLIPMVAGWVEGLIIYSMPPQEFKRKVMARA